jgi:hypothetical protein
MPENVLWSAFDAGQTSTKSGVAIGSESLATIPPAPPASLPETHSCPFAYVMPVANWSPGPPKTLAVGDANVAVVDELEPASVIWHVKSVVHPPPFQPENVAPPDAVAVRVTGEPSTNVAEHEDVQPLIPAGLDDTEPLPTTVTEIVCVSWNVAVTLTSAESEAIVKLGLPVESPVKPVKTSEPEAVPVTVTAVPLSIVAEQLDVHAAAAPPKSTVPPPSPANATLTVYWRTNVAVTVASLLSENAQPAPLQPSPQESKRDPELAACVSVTGVPSGSCTEQEPLVVPAVAEQEIAGIVFDEMLPDPLPRAVTVSVCSLTNVAVTFFAPPTVTEQVAPVQSPLNPENMLPAAGVGVSVTDVPMAKLVEQDVPQAIPDGVEVTVPLPLPAIETTTGKSGVSQTFAVPFAAHV